MAQKPTDETSVQVPAAEKPNTEPEIRIIGPRRPILSGSFPQARPVDLPRVIHLLRRAALTLQQQDPVAPVLKEVVANLLHSGSRAESYRHKLTTLAAALALDPHSGEAERDVKAALELLTGPTAGEPAAPA